jgi:YD repeat-containing protein
VDYPNGVRTTTAYDALSRGYQIRHSKGGAELLRSFQTYDAVGRPLTKSTSLGTFTYSYDLADQLTGEATPYGLLTYTYDAGYRRTSQQTQELVPASVSIYVRGGSFSGTNFNGVSPALVGDGGTGDTTYLTYLRLWVPPALPIQTFLLKLTASTSTGTSSCEVCSTGNSWLASSLTYSNAPAVGSVLGSFTATTTPTEFTLDISSLVSQAIASDGTDFSVVLRGVSGSSANVVSVTNAQLLNSGNVLSVYGSGYTPDQLVRLSQGANHVTYTYDAVGRELSSLSAVMNTFYDWNADDRLCISTHQLGQGE